MELPTYTNIWKIEKRLYKLYDFRLPMPLPVGQVAAFLAIAIPYMLILTMAGMPFSHTWVWLYVLPPGVLAWLVTRPVLEGKRLPELVLSQLRYLSEPRTWCRMAPLAERDQIFVAARVWRRSVALPPAALPPAAVPQAEPRQDHLAGARHADVGLVVGAASDAVAEPAAAATPAAAAADIRAGSVRPVWPNRPAITARATGLAARSAAGGQTERAVPATPVMPAVPAASAMPAVPAASATPATAAARAQPAPATVRATAGPVRATAAPASAGASQPTLTVRTDSTAGRPLHVVERALRNSPGARSDGWHDHVVVVPGGHRPGKPDQVQRDQARARLPLPGPARIVVLGCTAGAGQTATTLLTGHLLASLRSEAVAVLDLSSGPGSLTEQARQIPRLLPGRQGTAAADEPGLNRERGLQVVTADRPADQPEDAGRLIDAVVARYPITLADPAAGRVPRALQIADQLILVAPASADAAGSLAMTLEWLEAHGHANLARAAITVLNGVSDQTAPYVDKAAAVAAGRCRAVVQVPWDGRLAGGSAVGSAAVQAYTALAGVLVSGLADPAELEALQSESGRR
jgi:TcpE family